MNRGILNRLLFRTFFLQTGFCYERLQGLGWCWIIKPLAKKFQVPNPTDFHLKNLEPFNANPYISTYAAGAVAKLVEEKRDLDDAQRLKNSLRGPLGSLGDNLIWKGIRPTLLTSGILATFWLGFWGGVIFLGLFNLFQLYLRWRGVKRGYQLGEQIFVEFSGNFWRKAPAIFSAAGAMLLGIMLVLKGGEYFLWSWEAGMNFVLALAVSLIGFFKRISALDVFLLCLGSGLAVKIVSTLAG